MIFQQFNLVGRLDVLTNVLMGRLATVPTWRSLVQLWPDEDKAIAMSALEQFDMAAIAAQRADQLSGGQQQRVAIARALVQEPEIILADEPIASLDPRNTRIVMDALLRINKHFGITVICNLHSLDLARGYCDRLIGMAAGRVVFDGAPRGADRRGRARALRPRGRRGDGRRACGDARRRSCPSRSAMSRRPERRCPATSDKTTATPTGEKRHAQSSYRLSRGSRPWPSPPPRLPCAGLEGEVSRTRVRHRPGRERLRRHRPLGRRSSNYLAKELGTKVTLRIANDYAAVIEGQRAGNIHIAMHGPASYARAYITGAKVEPFAIEVNGDGTKGYYSVLYVKKDAPYQKIEDLKGKNLVPGRSELDLRQQRAALRHEQDGHRSGQASSARWSMPAATRTR